ncbi:MAG: glycosyltransferase [Lachnospira sp.]
MKIVVFGTGKLYDRYKTRLRDGVEIVNLIDNNTAKIGTYIDGIKVVSPEELKSIDYEYICLLSAYEEDMRKQLIDMGINRNLIADSERWEMFFVKDYYTVYPTNERGNTTNILIFFSALSYTGAQNVQLPLIEALIEKSYNVRVVSKNNGPLKNILINMGVSVIIMDDYRAENTRFFELIKWADTVIVNTLWLYYVIQEIDRIIVENRADIKVKWWIHEYGAVKHLEKTEFARLITLPYVKSYAVSQLLIRQLEEYCGIHNVIKLFMFGIKDYFKSGCILDYENNNRDDCIMTFSIIGFIGETKGQDIFIEMIKKLPVEYREKSRFLIVGAGSLTDSEKEDVAKIPQVSVIGEIPNSEIYKIYNESDVIISCSREDSMSVVVIEGFMNEKPAIVSDAIGIADFITDGVDGFVVKSEDVAGFAQKVMWMIDNREQCKEMGIRARYIYDKTFTIQKFKERIETIFLADSDK